MIVEQIMVEFGLMTTILLLLCAVEGYVTELSSEVAPAPSGSRSVQSDA